MTTFIAVDGSKTIAHTRAGLMQHPAFASLRTDGDGNPCVWENHYQKDTHSWSSPWSCQCDDDDVSPYRSDWIGPGTNGDATNGFYRLWESLPEAGDKAGEDAYSAQAEPGGDDRTEYAFDVTMIATIRMKAASEAEAREMMADALDCCTFNFGAWPDGEPIVGGASIQDDGTLIEINGEAV